MPVLIQEILKRNKRLSTVVYLLVFPIFMIVLEILIRFVFNFGTYLGTFIRALFEYFC